MNAPTAQSGEDLEAIALTPRTSLAWLIEELRWLFRVIVSSADRFYWDNGFSKAASLAYSTLLSLVPAIALAFGLLSSFAVSAQYVQEVRRIFFKQFIPDLKTVDTVIEYLTVFSQALSSMNALVIAFLVLTSILLLNSIEYALNEVWQVFESRSFAHRIQIFSAIILIFPALLVSGAYFVTLRVEPYLSNLPVDSLVQSVYNYLFPFAIDFLAFLSLYYLVPKAPVRLRSAFFGAVLAAVLFGVAKGFFAVYVEKFSSYSKVYGTVAGIPIFLFWLYVAWSILLFGAECSYQAQYLPRRGKLWKRTVMAVGDAELLLATQALLMVTKSFLAGRPPHSDIEIAEALGCSTVVLKPALSALERADIIARGDSRDAPLTLLKSPDQIKLEELRNALFHSRKSVHYAEEMSRVFAAFGVAQSAAVSNLAEIIDQSAQKGTRTV